MVWHRTFWGDLALRASGFVLLFGALSVLRALFSAGPRAAMPRDYALAALGFVGFSAGNSLFWLGKHLFDQVEIAPRWAIWRAETLGK